MARQTLCAMVRYHISFILLIACVLKLMCANETCEVFGQWLTMSCTLVHSLFKERIKFLDKKIHPGLTKLTWGAKNISDYFIKDCRVHANRVSLLNILVPRC